MQKVEAKYHESFPPGDQATEVLYTEGVENCITKNLYSVLFGDIGVGNASGQASEQNAAHMEEIEQNKQIRDSIAKFGAFVKPRHLELDEKRLIEDQVQKACHQFTSINKLKTPKGKLNSIINFSKVISMMLQESSKDGTPDGADMFFPCAVYALLQLQKYEVEGTNSTKLLRSNLQYVRMFRQESLLHGQDEYYLTTLESVIEFIQNLSETYRTNLKLEPGEDFPSELDQWMWSEPQPSAPDADAAPGKGASSHQ